MSSASKIFCWASKIISCSIWGVNFLSDVPFPSCSILSFSKSYSDANALVNMSFFKSDFSAPLVNCAAWKVSKGPLAAPAAVANSPLKPFPVGVLLARSKPNDVKNLVVSLVQEQVVY